MRAPWPLALLLLAACEPEPPVDRAMAPGNIDRGREAIRRFECGACHVIPGVRSARGRTGPTLAEFGRRVYIAGAAPNDPDTLARFLRDPPALSPHTSMPAMGIDEHTARDMAAYLLSLE
jgi:cytochrome c2